MKKVCILSNKIPYPTKDGSSIAMARLLESFLGIEEVEITYGAINTVKHYKHPDDFPHSLRDRVTLHSFDEDTSPRISTGLFNLLFTNKPYNVSRFFVYSMREWLNTFDDYHFDLIVIEGAFMGYYVPLAKTKGRRVVLRSHNLEFLIWKRTEQTTNDPFKKLYFRIQSRRLQKFEEKLAMICDDVWSISPVDNLWFKSINRHSYFIPASVSPGKPTDKILPNRCFHLGAMDWTPNRMGVDWFLQEIWPRVLRTNPAAEFHLAGNAMPAHLKTDPSRNLFVHGRVPSAEAFAKQHGIAILPLLAGSGVRIKLLENATWGIPMISTRIGAEGVFEDGSGCIVLSDFPEDFAIKLAKLMAQPEEALAMGLRGREVVQRDFGKEEAVRKIKEVWLASS